MRASLIYATALILGIVVGLINIKPFNNFAPELIELFLYIFLFFLGIGIGLDYRNLKKVLALNFMDVLTPFMVVLGSIAGAIGISLLLPDLKLSEAMVVGSGLGYYSLSSILVTQIAGERLGLITLVANLFREIFTMFFAPILSKVFGGFAPIASGGATSMDTTLPFIIKASGEKYLFTSLFNGMVLSLLVPILIPLILSFGK